MPQMTNYKEQIMKFFLKPILGPFKIGLILSIWLYSKHQKLLNFDFLFMTALQKNPPNKRKA